MARWFTKNFSNVLSILGLLATLYFGIIYVPAWLEESRNEKLRNAKITLQQSVKELIFSDSTFEITEYIALIHAKEIEIKEKYPYSLPDVLTQAEESFMEDKFLPLDRRRTLIQKIERIKISIPKDSIVTQGKKSVSQPEFEFGVLASIIVSLLTGFFGIFSLYQRYRTEKETQDEISNEIQEVHENVYLGYAYDFEKQIRSIINKYPGLSIQEKDYAHTDIGVDVIFSFDEKEYFVELKFLQKSKVGLSSIRQLKSYILNKTGEAWLVYNTDITALVKQEVDDFNSNNRGIKIRLIRVSNPSDFEQQLPDLLRTL